MLPLVEEHSGKEGEVFSGGEKSGVSGASAHSSGKGIVHVAAGDLRLDFDGGGDSGEEVGRRKKAGVGHSKREVKGVWAELVQRGVGNLLDDFAEQNVVEVAVFEF